MGFSDQKMKTIKERNERIQSAQKQLDNSTSQKQTDHTKESSEESDQ